MPIDPRIALGFKPTYELESPQNIEANVMKLQNAKYANELARMQSQEYARGLQEQEGLRNYLAGVQDVNAPEVGLNALKYGTAGANLAKTLAERAKDQATLKKTQAETESSQFKLQQDKLTHGIQSVGSAKNAADVMAALDEGVQQGYFTKEQADAQKAEVASLQNMPQFQAWQQKKLQALTNAKDQLAMTVAKPQEIKRADGSIIFLDSNPNSPTFRQEVMPSQAAGMTPAQIKQDEVARGYLRLAQDRERRIKETPQALQNSGLTPEEQSVISQGIAEGRVDPNKVNGRNAKIIATTLMQNPDANLVNLGIDAASTGQAAKSLAVQGAKMSTAATEAAGMIDVTKNLSDKVNRTQYPTINAIENAVNKGTGGIEIVQLNASINALINSYSRAISPTGVPTVSDKNHAREIINSAYSTGQIAGVLNVMQQEMDIAKSSVVKSNSHLMKEREKRFGRGKENLPEPKRDLKSMSNEDLLRELSKPNG